MAEVPTEHLQLQKIRAACEAILGKLDDTSNPQLTDLYSIVVRELRQTNVMNFEEGIVGGDFEEWYNNNKIPIGWFFMGLPQDTFRPCQRVNQSFSGIYALDLKNTGFPGGWNGLYYFFSIPINVDDIEWFSLMFWDVWSSGEVCLKVEFIYADGTKDIQSISDPDFEWIWLKRDLTPTAGKFLIAIRLFSDHDDYKSFGTLYVDSVTLKIRKRVVIRPPATILAGQQTVPTAGTPVALGSGAVEHSVLIQPIPTNTGNILVGNASGQHFVLTPTSEPIRIFVDDLADIHLDASVDGEGVNYIGG